jgi:8-oxo-dGTP pyrophosphatase MutT (NUDIX family)
VLAGDTPARALPPAPALAEAIGRVLARRAPLRMHERARRAAVLVVLYDAAGVPYLILTKRSETVAHPGQISLPGGRVEAADATLAATAVRETEEELGVPADALRVVGRLDDVHTLGSDFVVSPFVGLLAGPFRPVPSDAEVALVLQVPVADLLAADDLLPAEPAPLELRYPLLAEDVWGATARILRDFVRVTRQALAEEGVSPPGAPPGSPGPERPPGRPLPPRAG